MLGKCVSVIGKLYWIVCTIFLISLDVYAVMECPDVSALSSTPLRLSPYLSTLQDSTRTLSFADVQSGGLAAQFKSTQNNQSDINLGFTPDAYWFRLCLKNVSNQEIERIFEIDNYVLSNISFYQPNKHGSYQAINTGQAESFSTRPYKSRHYVFPIRLPENATQIYYLRIKSADAISIPAKLWLPLAFHDHERAGDLWQAWYIGIATAMVIFNLLLFISLRDQTYLRYVVFTVSSTMTIAAMNGVGHEFFWPDATKWANSSIFVGFSVSIAAFIAFMMRMLDIQVRTSKMYQLCLTLLSAHVVMALCNLISVETFAFYAEVLNFLSAVIIIAVALKCLYQGQRSALFFIIAFLIFMLTGMIHGLMDFGALPANIFTTNALQIGSISEMLLLAFALAYRFDLIKKEIIRTKNKQIAADELLVLHLQESERRLEDRVAERTDELQKLNKKLEELSETDGLTGIANRRCFNIKLEEEWRRALRNDEPLTLAILDVDWFKKYNDHYGHPAGDECLRQVAQICVQIYCRPGDLAARYGGEEFAFITPATSIEGALSIAQKVCKTVESHAIPHAQSKFNHLSVSIGIASILPSEVSDSESLLLAADQALYRAKNMGRNQASL